MTPAVYPISRAHFVPGFGGEIEVRDSRSAHSKKCYLASAGKFAALVTQSLEALGGDHATLTSVVDPR